MISKKDDFFLHISGGFVEVKPNSQVVVLADAAEHSFEIDAERALEAKKRAEAAMSQTRINGEEYAKVAAALERSLSRINVSRKHAHRKNPLPSEGVMNE